MKKLRNIFSRLISYTLFITGNRDYKIPKIEISKNKKLYILGTASSIKNINLSKLNKEDVFLCNRGYLLEKNGLDISKVKYYISIDSRFYYENRNELEEKTKNIKYRFWGNYFYKKKYYNDFFIKYNGKLINNDFKSFSPNKGLHETSTVVFSALQIAEFLGYSDIYFLGVDFEMENGVKYFYNGRNNGRDNINTFNTDKILEEFIKIYKEFSSKGINIFIGNKNSILTTVAKFKDF